MKAFIQKVTAREHLSRSEAMEAMRTIMDGKATEGEIAALLVGLKMKGETTDELLGFVTVMREKSVKVEIEDKDAIDMCGTGGDASGTFNISTVASFVVAGAGVTVAKHGNRSVSNSCGSADVLSALGIKIDLSHDNIAACINSVGIGFLFAPLFHPAMKFAAKPRKELGVKTCFNMLGPMTNPAGVQRQLVGAYSDDAATMMASVFAALGARRVCVVHAADGLDEISLGASTTITEVTDGMVRAPIQITATTLGLPSAAPSMIQGSSAEANADIARRILGGENGPHRNIVLANAAAGLFVAGRVHEIRDGVELAADSIDSGKAARKLELLREFSHS